MLNIELVALRAKNNYQELQELENWLAPWLILKLF